MQATVVGGGLAGCEAAWQLARRGVSVRLHEMKPAKRTPAQTSDALAELVCSNSMRGAALVNAVGLLKEEMRRAGSLVLACADLARVRMRARVGPSTLATFGVLHLPGQSA